MNPHVKAQWVAALRSGEYQQGRGQLRDNDAFCCLGVLCEISGLSQWNQDGAYGGSLVLPPDPVIGWSGLPTPDPRVRVGASEESLSNLNDGVGVHAHTFDQIADLIEAQL